MHHIKLRGKLITGNTEVEVEVIEQTHTEYSFGPHKDPGGSSYTFFIASNGLSLKSITCPAYYAGSEIFLRGRRNKAPNWFTVPLGVWKQLRVAVAEYNEWGKNQ